MNTVIRNRDGSLKKSMRAESVRLTAEALTGQKRDFTAQEVLEELHRQQASDITLRQVKVALNTYCSYSYEGEKEYNVLLAKNNDVYSWFFYELHAIA